MFGLMRGCSCTLDLAERQAWRGYFCGLCLAIKDNQGQMARIATNHDAALLGVLCDAQDPGNTTWRTSFCPLRRPIKTTIVDPQTPGAKFAASMAILMAATRVEDHVADGELFWGRHPRFSKWLSQKWQYAASQTAAATGFDAAIIAVQTRRLLEYCGLPWEDDCLKFYETERAVVTASSEQVRQPIHPGAVGSWRRFEKHLGPLIEVLEPLL